MCRRLQPFGDAIPAAKRPWREELIETANYYFTGVARNDREAVDRGPGLVFAFAFFDHEQINWTWQLGELFKIENGLIHRVEAVFHRAPYGIPSGWSTFEQAMPTSIQSVRRAQGSRRRPTLTPA